jgi:hypothetical protein
MPETGDPRHPSFLKPRKIRVANPPLFPPPPFREFMLFNRKRRPTFSAAKPSLWKNPASGHKGNRCRYQRRWRDGSRFDRGCAARRLIHVAAYIEQHSGSAATIKQHMAAIQMMFSKNIRISGLQQAFDVADGLPPSRPPVTRPAA